MNRDDEMDDSDRTHPHRRFSDTHLDGARRRFLRFDPTFSSGTIMTIASFLVTAGLAYGQYRSDQKERDAEITAIKVQATVDRERASAAVTQMTADIKDLKGDVSKVSEIVTVIKAQRDAQMQFQQRAPR